ncbi:MAG: hypothetical protein IJ228_11950 [Succinivibrio sp.]|nr:hypothetical protein [Succinivibrio sp.]
MAFLDRSMLIGLAAGLVVGVLGTKYYGAHKNEIDDKLRALRGVAGGEGAADGTASDMTLEELESQKERLEDLIADVKSKQG